jgi:hypothetical protein
VVAHAQHRRIGLVAEVTDALPRCCSLWPTMKAGHGHRPIASWTRRAAERLSTSRCIVSSAFSLRSRSSSARSSSFNASLPSPRARRSVNATSKRATRAARSSLASPRRHGSITGRHADHRRRLLRLRTRRPDSLPLCVDFSPDGPLLVSNQHQALLTLSPMATWCRTQIWLRYHHSDAMTSW